jgi:MFS family permease
MPVVVDRPKPQPAGVHAMLVLICVSVPSFMLQLDSNIVAASLPSISESLGATFAGIEWVITAYTLSFASLLLPAGALADYRGAVIRRGRSAACAMPRKRRLAPAQNR